MHGCWLQIEKFHQSQYNEHRPNQRFEESQYAETKGGSLADEVNGCADETETVNGLSAATAVMMNYFCVLVIMEGFS
jgi:hypothetical protein